MNERGVTFIELVICIGILTIIGSSSMLMLGQSLSKQELANASLELAADLRWLQQLAINGDRGTVSYILLFKLQQPYGYYITANMQVIKKNTFPPTVRIFANDHTICFGLSGAPLKGAQTISLQNTKLNTYQYVILAPVTGRVRISDSSPHQGEDY